MLEHGARLQRSAKHRAREMQAIAIQPSCTLHPPLMAAPASLMADVTALMAGSLHMRVCKRVC